MAHPRRNPDTSYRRVGEKALVVVPDRAEVNVLNAVGITVFSLLDGSRDVDQLAAAVEAEFDVDHERAKADVLLVLDDFRRHGMLDESGDAEGRTE
jgi:hypothetical protein